MRHPEWQTTYSTPATQPQTTLVDVVAELRTIRGVLERLEREPVGPASSAPPQDEDEVAAVAAELQKSDEENFELSMDKKSLEKELAHARKLLAEACNDRDAWAQKYDEACDRLAALKKGVA